MGRMAEGRTRYALCYRAGDIGRVGYVPGLGLCAVYRPTTVRARRPLESGKGPVRRQQRTLRLLPPEDSAQEAADLAIAALSRIPDSDHKQALIAIAEFAVQRRS